MGNPTLYFALLLIAVILFVLHAFGARSSKADLLSLGLAFAFAVPMLQQLHRL